MHVCSYNQNDSECIGLAKNWDKILIQQDQVPFL